MAKDELSKPHQHSRLWQITGVALAALFGAVATQVVPAAADWLTRHQALHLVVEDPERREGIPNVQAQVWDAEQVVATSGTNQHGVAVFRRITPGVYTLEATFREGDATLQWISRAVQVDRTPEPIRVTRADFSERLSEVELAEAARTYREAMEAVVATDEAFERATRFAAAIDALDPQDRRRILDAANVAETDLQALTEDVEAQRRQVQDLRLRMPTELAPLQRGDPSLFAEEEEAR